MVKRERFRQHAAICASALALGLLVTGCTEPDDNPPSPSSAPPTTAAPAFASEEEALEAATEAYIKYYRVSDEVLEDRGKEFDKLRSVTTAAQFQFEAPDYEAAKRDGVHSRGRTSLDTFSLQDYSPTAQGGVEMVTIYACVDLSKVRLFDSDDSQIPSVSDESRFSFAPTFDLVGGTLLVSGNEPWTGGDFCDA